MQRVICRFLHRYSGRYCWIAYWRRWRNSHTKSGIRTPIWMHWRVGVFSCFYVIGCTIFISLSCQDFLFSDEPNMYGTAQEGRWPEGEQFCMELHRREGDLKGSNFVWNCAGGKVTWGGAILYGTAQKGRWPGGSTVEEVNQIFLWQRPLLATQQKQPKP